MLFTQEQLRGLYYLSVAMALTVFIPLFFGSVSLPAGEVLPEQPGGYTLVSDTIDGLPDSLFRPRKRPEGFVRSRREKVVTILELNRADSADLVQFKGIGPVYASRILKYRERLGGFFDVRQLKELDMKYFNFDSLAHFFTVDTSFIRKKDIGSMEFKELLRHPYMDYETVSMIFDYKRKKDRPHPGIKELDAAGIFRRVQFIKLSFYFN